MPIQLPQCQDLQKIQMPCLAQQLQGKRELQHHAGSCQRIARTWHDSNEHQQNPVKRTEWVNLKQSSAVFPASKHALGLPKKWKQPSKNWLRKNARRASSAGLLIEHKFVENKNFHFPLDKSETAKTKKVWRKANIGKMCVHLEVKSWELMSQWLQGHGGFNGLSFD